MSSNLFGYDNSLLFYETPQPHFLFESAPEIEENFLIEESTSLLPPKPELELSFGSYFSSSNEFIQRYYCQNELNFHFDRVLESARNHLLDSPESSINADLQKEKTKAVAPFCNEKSEATLKVGKYSKEERKLRIDRYKAKRTRRNFNKTIKYACRKTLADGRQRIRGRFVRNDEAGQILQPSLFQTCQDKYHLWIDDWLVS